MAGNATNKIADAVDKAGESLQEVSQSVSSMGASWGGVGTFLRNMTVGRFGWLGKIAGALLGMMLIGNNSKVAKPLTPAMSEEQGRPGGMRR